MPTKNKRTLETRGRSTSYITTGGAGYIPTAIDADAVINKISNLWNYGKTYLKNKFSGTGDGTFINLSDKNVSRIKSNTKGVKTILTNEFVEKNKNTVRKKKDFVNTTDTLLGDKKIPLSKISTFYGVEDGKLKAGPLASFKDETVVVPNRTKHIGKIKKILMASPEANKNVWEREDSVINAYNKSKGYKQGIFYDIANTIFPWTSPATPRRILFSNEGRSAIRRVLNESGIDFSYTGDKAITESGDTITLPELNATPKVMFANESGNAAFLSNIRNPKNVEQLNTFLAQNPSYPIMVDNGRYSSYMDNLPNAEIYGGLNRPDDMFIIGTTYRPQHKDEGIYIKPSKRGTFTTAATKHGMSVQEFVSKVLRNKENYSPAMVKKANFARNASHWKHGLGGNLFSGEEKGSQQMNIFRRPNGEYFYQASPDSEEITVTPVNTLFDDPALWTYTDNNGRLYTPRKAAPYTQGTITEKEDEGPLVEAAKNYLGELQYDINNGVPIGGKYTMPAIAASALLPLAGEAFAGINVAGIPATTWVDAALTAGFGAHGLNHIINEGINGYGDAAMTALELAPLGRLAKPLYEGVVQPGMRLFNSPLTGNWTRIGNREYRLSPNSFGANGIPIESRKVGDYSTGIDLNKMRSILEDYEKGLTQYKGSKLPSSLEYNYEMPKIDFDNLIKDDFVEYLSQQTGRKIKRVPIKDTKHGDIYNEGFAFVDDEGKEIAHIAGRRKVGKNVYVESSYVDPEFRYKGLGKQMYFDLNDHVFSTYGTTLRSDPMQRVGSTGIGMSPSNRLWKSLRDNGMSTVEGEGFNRYDIMAEPSKITTAYRTPATPQITAENATSITPEQWTAAQDAAIARGDMVEAQRLRDLHFKISAPNTKVNTKVYHGNRTDNSITAFDKSKIGSEHKDVGLDGFWFIDNPETAKWEYALKPESWGKGIENAQFGEVIPAYINLENPAKLEQFGLKMKKSPYGDYPSADESLVALFKRAKSEGTGKDGFIFRLKDSDGNAEPIYESIQNQFVVRNPTRIKSADAVTYDNNGVRIPLGQRDNFNINDIRYAIAPFLIGGAAYGLSNKKANGGSIHIAPSKRGTFTTAATKHGMSVQEFASKVLRNKEDYSPSLVKKANFARNASKWH